MQGIPLRPDGLQLDEDRQFQERYWNFERVGWATFAVILMLAVFGFTGSGGPVSVSESRIGNALLTYPTIARWSTPDTLQVRFLGSEAGEIRLGPDFLSAFEVQVIQPEPSESSVGPNGLSLKFDVTGATTLAPINLTIQPRRPGTVSFEVSIDGSDSAQLSTLVMP
jgi:hypothetical protein